MKDEKRPKTEAHPASCGVISFLPSYIYAGIYLADSWTLLNYPGDLPRVCFAWGIVLT